MVKNAQTTILLIGDGPTDVRLIEELLHGTSQDSFHVITASTLAQGLKLLSANSIDVILLDLGLPDSQGLDTFYAINEHASHLPIIILTISDDEPLGQWMFVVRLARTCHPSTKWCIFKKCSYAWFSEIE
ncbi:MAG: response regulator transcription factor [Halobacteriota archaeon]